MREGVLRRILSHWRFATVFPQCTSFLMASAKGQCPPPNALRQHLELFYQRVNPARLPSLDAIVASFSGVDVAELITGMRQRYPQHQQPGGPIFELEEQLTLSAKRRGGGAASSPGLDDASADDNADERQLQAASRRPRSSPVTTVRPVVSAFFPQQVSRSSIIESSKTPLQAAVSRLQSLRHDIDRFDPHAVQKQIQDLEEARDTAEFEADKLRYSNLLSQMQSSYVSQVVEFKHAVHGVEALAAGLLRGVTEIPSSVASSQNASFTSSANNDSFSQMSGATPDVGADGATHARHRSQSAASNSRAIVDMDPSVPMSARVLLKSGRTANVGDDQAVRAVRDSYEGQHDDDGASSSLKKTSSSNRPLPPSVRPSRPLPETGPHQQHAPSRFSITSMDRHYLTAAKSEVPDLDALLSKRVVTGVSAAVQFASTSSLSRAVFDVVPLGEERNVISDVIMSQASPGDIIVLHPGVYYENIVVSDFLEIRPAIESQGGSGGLNHRGRHSGTDGLAAEDDATMAGGIHQEVIIYPADPNAPVLQVVQSGMLKLSSVIIKGRKPLPKASRAADRAMLDAANVMQANSAAQVPLICLSGNAKLELHNSALVDGRGGGLMALGHAQIRMHHCIVRSCGFAGVYCKDETFSIISRCSFVSCEVALRFRESTFALEESDIRGSTSDGVVCHGPAKGVIEKCALAGNKANAILLSTSSDVLITHCLIADSGKWGVYSPIGADYAVVATQFHANTMGDFSRPPPVHSRFHR